jgi:hypothetical protein
VSILEKRIAAIGAGTEPEAGDWRIDRVGAATAGPPDAHELTVGELSMWLDRLRDRTGPPVYGIRRTRQGPWKP